MRERGQNIGDLQYCLPSVSCKNKWETRMQIKHARKWLLRIKLPIFHPYRVVPSPPVVDSAGLSCNRPILWQPRRVEWPPEPKANQSSRAVLASLITKITQLTPGWGDDQHGRNLIRKNFHPRLNTTGPPQLPHRPAHWRLPTNLCSFSLNFVFWKSENG